MPAERFELPELPNFSEMQQIKEAVRPPLEMPRMQAQPAAFPVMPARREERAVMPEQRAVTQEISEPMVMHAEREMSYSRAKEPIFVKIDKFKEALANFEIIKEKLLDIDNLLKKIKETKAKEQEELDSWEKEVEDIKAKAQIIDERLFSKIG